MGNYFTKHHPPHHHREICAMYLYMTNDLPKIDHKIVHKWANAMLTQIHTVAVTPVHTVAIRKNVLFCKGVLMLYVCTDTQIPKQ